MGVSYNSVISRDGLLLHLVAGNSRSYPGTGTTWYDLSGNNNHGTMISGATYSSSNGGIVSFNGVSSYISTNSISFGVTHTFSTWFYQGNIPTNYNVNALFGEPGSSNTCPIMLNSTDMIYSMSSSGASVPRNYQLNKWTYLATVRSGATVFFYSDGVFLGSNPVPNSITTFTLQKIGARQLISGLYAFGRMDDVRAYNRALSPVEILQIFNSTRRRFGV